MEQLIRRRYFLKLYFGIVSIFCAFTIIIVSSIYISLRGYTAQMENDKSKVLLSQSLYSLESMNDMVRSLCLTAYYNPDVQVLMYDQTPDSYETMNSLNRVKSRLLRNNSFVHSLYIYNGRKDTLYSTFHAYTIEDPEFWLVVETTRPLPILRPILRVFHDELTGTDTPVLSYFMYETVGENQMMENGIVVNVEARWFLNSLEKLNAIMQNNNKIYIYAPGYNTFLSSGTEAEMLPEMAAIQDYFSTAAPAPSGEPTVVSLRDAENTEYVVTYEYWADTGWILVKVQPQFSINAYLQSIFTSLLYTALAALLGGIVAYYFISKSLYSPVKNTLALLPQDSALPDAKDEFLSIHNALKKYQSDSVQMEFRQTKHADFSKYFYLQHVVQNSSSLSIAELARSKSEYRLLVDFTAPTLLGLVRIAHFQDLLQNNPFQDMQLLKYAVRNICMEIMDRHLPNECVEIHHDSILFIANAGENTPGAMVEALHEIRNNCKQVLRLSLFCTVSDPSAELKNLTDVYFKMLDQADYHLVLGPDAVISSKDISALHQTDDIQQVLKLEDAIVQNLDLDHEILYRQLCNLFAEMRRLRFRNIVFVVMRLQRMLLEMLNDSALSGTPPTLHYDRFENDTLDDIRESIYHLILAVKSLSPPLPSTPADAIARRAQELIEKQYGNLELNAAFIACELNVTPSALSRAFKSHTNMTIPEYLNLIRMTRAAEFLEREEGSIPDVMKKVGIESESSFYRLFRKVFHMTPREYIALNTSSKPPQGRRNTPK